MYFYHPLAANLPSRHLTQTVLYSTFSVQLLGELHAHLLNLFHEAEQENTNKRTLDMAKNNTCYRLGYFILLIVRRKKVKFGKASKRQSHENKRKPYGEHISKPHTRY